MPTTKTAEGYRNNPDLHILNQNILPLILQFPCYYCDSKLHSWRNIQETVVTAECGQIIYKIGLEY